MSKIFSSIMLVISVFSLVAHAADKAEKLVKNPVVFGLEGSKTNLEFLVVGSVNSLKGIILGLQQGLLNDERIRLSSKCFGSDKINQDLMFMLEFANRKGSITDAVRFAKNGQDLIIHEAKNCRFTSTISLL